MLIPDHKIEGCVSKEVVRYALNKVNLNVKRSRLEATDGKMLAVVPVELDPADTGGLIEPKQIAEGRKIAKKYKGKKPEMAVDGCVKFMDGSTQPRPNDAGTYPDVDGVLFKKPEGPADLTVNAEALHTLSMALSQNHGGFPNVRIWVVKDDKGVPDKIYVEAQRCADGAFGILMCVRT